MIRVTVELLPGATKAMPSTLQSVDIWRVADDGVRRTHKYRVGLVVGGGADRGPVQHVTADGALRLVQRVLDDYMGGPS